MGLNSKNRVLITLIVGFIIFFSFMPLLGDPSTRLFAIIPMIPIYFFLIKIGFFGKDET